MVTTPADVFTPGDYPEHTYVERDQGNTESYLEYQLEREGAIVTISGPSKSGKSVLVRKVVGSEDLVSVYGGQIESVEELWDKVLDALGAPSSSESVTIESEESQTSTNVGIRAHLLSGGHDHSEGESVTEETTQTFERRGLEDVVRINDTESFVLLVDDFHYMDPSTQTDIGESIKQASEAGLRICVALIPHRSDDLTRANPDLQGRITSIELDYWGEDDLQEIGHKGFDALGVEFPENAIGIFAKESAGSPQLMQQLCYDVFSLKSIEAKGGTIEINRDELEFVLNLTGNSQNLQHVFDILNGEGIAGGGSRNIYEFTDGNEGDVYEAILRGIASDPIENSIDRRDLMTKIDGLCLNDSPHTSSITQSLERMNERISESFQERMYFEWEEEINTVAIPDPYLIFYLRWSDALDYFPEIDF